MVPSGAVGAMEHARPRFNRRFSLLMERMLNKRAENADTIPRSRFLLTDEQATGGIEVSYEESHEQG
jgi:hypothetical protein